MYRDCLAIQRRVLGNKHSSTLSSIGSLAGLYELQGRYGEAEPLKVECIQGRRRVFGNKHDYTIGTIYGLGDMYHTQGNMVKAQPQLDEYKALKARSSK